MNMAQLLIILCSMKYANAGWSSGMATYYSSSSVTNDDGNACGMSGTASAFSDWKFAAIGGSEFNSGYGCGKCYTIKATGAYGSNPSCKFDTKSITIQAMDQCPECAKNHFDLNDDVMTYLTGSASMAKTCGEVSIKYKRVDCTAIKSNFYIKNKDGTSQYWYGFKLNDVNDDGGIKSVKLYKSGSYVTSCSKSNGPSYWLCNGGSKIAKSTPLDIEIISDKGKKVTAKNCITSFTGNKIMKCNTNLSSGSSYTEDDDTPTSHYWYSGIIAVVLVACIICGFVGYCYVKRRRQKAKDAVSFIDADGNATTQAGDGDSEATGYDMNPIDTTGADTPNSETPADTPADTPVGDDHDGDQEINIEVEVEAEANITHS